MHEKITGGTNDNVNNEGVLTELLLATDRDIEINKFSVVSSGIF
jgi:hypothetical protein